MKFAILWVVAFISTHVWAQSTNGLTYIADTSYSNWSAYFNSKKSHPQTQWVKEFNFENISEKRDIIYREVENQTLKLDAFFNKSIDKKPAIIIVHGGGWRSGNRKQHIPMAEKLASLGYACFTVQYGLSTHALFPAAVQDLKASIKWVKSHSVEYGIDTNKVAVCGFSAGGQLAALIGNTNGNSYFEPINFHSEPSSNVHAIIDLDGILAFIHPESGEGDDSKGTSAATYWFGYSINQNPELWHKASALSYAGQNSLPTLFINSSVPRMHAGREDYCQVLRKNNIYSEVKTFHDAPHSFVQFEPWFTPMINIIDGFLKKIFLN